MRRLIAPPVLLLLATVAGATMTYTRCPGCLDRHRVNKTCDWAGDAVFAIDPQNQDDRRHLVADAQLAEEVAIRYADAEKKHRYGGVEWSGGLLEEGRVRNGCMARLVATIEANHGVTAQAVTAARAERYRPFDVAVGLTFVPLYSFGAMMVCFRLRRRFHSDHEVARAVAAVLSSLAFNFVALFAGRIWLGQWEVVRVGNGHLSGYRLALYELPWNVSHLLIGGLLLFWLIAFLSYRSADDTRSMSDHAVAQRVVFRS